MKVTRGYLTELEILWRFRQRLVEAVVQEVRQRYAGSVLGGAWALLYPATLLTIYTVIYVMIFRVRPPSMDAYGYLVLVFSGLVPLLSFNESLVAATGSLVANRSLLMNTVFPAELIPVRAALAAQTPSLFGLAITLAASIALERAGWATLLAVPLLWLFLLAFVIGLGWILSLVTIVVRDIQQVLGLLLMALFILSPVAYTPEMVPPALKAFLYLNPMSYFVMSFQAAICYGVWPEPGVILATAALGIGTFAVGFWFFLKAKFVFFDYA
jgi:lipopolysaccharide transport system permease protein